MGDYFHDRLPEILKKIKEVKPMPEPIDVLPKLPIHEERQFIEVPTYSKDGIVDMNGYYEVWKQDVFITNAETMGEAWNTYWSERIA